MICSAWLSSRLCSQETKICHSELLMLFNAGKTTKNQVIITPHILHLGINYLYPRVSEPPLPGLKGQQPNGGITMKKKSWRTSAKRRGGGVREIKPIEKMYNGLSYNALRIVFASPQPLEKRQDLKIQFYASNKMLPGFQPVFNHISLTLWTLDSDLLHRRTVSRFTPFNSIASLIALFCLI